MTFSYRVQHNGITYDIPDHTEIKLGFEFSDISGCSVNYPTNGINADHVVEDAVLIAFWDGAELRNGRFRLVGKAGDEATDDGSSKIIGGKNLFSIFEKVILVTTGGTRTFVASTPGQILHALFTEAQARGAMTGVTWDFTNGQTSAGLAWNTTYTSMGWKPNTTYLKIIQDLVDKASLEMCFDGTVIHAYNSGQMGTDLSNSIELVAGRDYADGPFKSTVEERAQFIQIVGDEGTRTSYTSPNISPNPFGREEVGLSQSGVKDTTLLGILGQAYADKVANGRSQLTRTVNIFLGSKVPAQDYRVGDWINERVVAVANGVATSTPDKYRVRAIAITDNGATPTAALVLNDRILEAEVQAARRIDSIFGGSSTSGGGNGLPTTTPGDDTTIPNPPSNLTTSAEQYLDANGIVRILLNAQWVAPTQNTDGSPIVDISEYEVQWQYI